MAGRPRVLAIIPGLFPSTIIGVARPLLRLHLLGRITLDLRLQFLVGRRAINRADIVVLGRQLSAPFAPVLELIKASGKPLVHELDDNLLDVPEDIPGLGYAREPAIRDLLIACLSHAAVVRVYSPAFQERLSVLNPNVQLVTGPLDWSLIPETLPPRDPSRVRLIYATSRLQDRIGLSIVPPLRRALDSFPQAELTVWGPQLEGLSDHPRVRHLNYTSDYESFVSQFVNEAFDIGLAPLPNDEFHRCKSNNKFREYASAGVAGLYSNMSVYNRWVEHGETGWLVPDGDEAWFDAIKHAITHTERRRSIAGKAFEFARAHFNEQVTEDEWMASLEAAAMQPVAPVDLNATMSSNGTAAANPLGQALGVGARILQAVKRDGVIATAMRARNPLTAASQLAQWEWRRWQLERRIRVRGAAAERRTGTAERG